MLTELRISNFALIDHLHIELSSGFFVLTGETGAGKSLLLDALLLLVGGRASSDHIRFGADEALLEASFTLPSTHSLVPSLRRDGFLLPDQLDLIIRRILSRAGKNRSYLNGQLAPLQTLQDVGSQLVEIHGQHDQQSLLSPKAQLKLLDAFGNLGGLVTRYQQAHAEWVEKQRALKELVQKAQDQSNRQDILQFQYDELTKIQLQAGEEEALNQEYHRLKYSGRLGELSHQAFETLYEGEGTVLGQLGEVRRWIRELGQIDNQGQSWEPLLESATIALQEVADHLREYRGQIEYDPDRMDVIDGRLASLQRLKKKYHKTVEELLEFSKTLKEDLAFFQQSDEHIALLQKDVTRSAELMNTQGLALSARRKKVAKHLVQQIKREFIALKMEPMDVQMHIERTNPEDAFGPLGMDRIELLLAPNPGEPPLPLSRIVSGGELSRIMLALKTVFAGNDQIPVVIFDEIDSGVGGEAGMAMGTRLRRLAQFHQVCCITHLPQIASQAHVQFVVEKTSSDDRTSTRVHQVTGVQREMEIARMLGGEMPTPTITKTAVEMLKRGSQDGVDIKKPQQNTAKN